MNKLNILFLTLAILLVASCSNTNFMGAKKWNYVGGYYVERWYPNPEYKDFEVPKGTAFYGAAAEKIKDRFIIKYYIAEKDGDSTTEIPDSDMWKVKHNGKNQSEQGDDNLFFYNKSRGGMIKQYAIPAGIMLPIKLCSIDGWCQMYITASSPNQTYVKRSILYQGSTILNEKEKKKLARDAMQATDAIYPWITPSFQTCEKQGGEMNSRGVCEAKWEAANRICAKMGGRLPTIEELKQVVIQCGGSVNVHHGNNKVSGYEACYRRKGFSYEYNGYFSSTVKVPKRNVYPSEAAAMWMSDSDSATGFDIMDYPRSILCIAK